MKKKEHVPTEQEIKRLEVARQLGLEEKILRYGWAELTAEESGRIGGILSGRSRAAAAARRRQEHEAIHGAGGALRPMDATGLAAGELGEVVQGALM